MTMTTFAQWYAITKEKYELRKISYFKSHIFVAVRTKRAKILRVIHSSFADFICVFFLSRHIWCCSLFYFHTPVDFLPLRIGFFLFTRCPKRIAFTATVFTIAHKKLHPQRPHSKQITISDAIYIFFRINWEDLNFFFSIVSWWVVLHLQYLRMVLFIVSLAQTSIHL